MASSTNTVDLKIAAMAFGFTLGFGFLTTWEAIKQTKRNRNPLRSGYIYMLWGEIAANLGISVLAWLIIDGATSPTIPVLFFVLFFWVFQVQLLMQIIINRIAIIAENRKFVEKLKWGTAAVMTVINVAVFCIFIPSHRDPPVSQTFVDINKYWDRLSKFLIMAIDAALNWYFLRTVQIRLVQQHNLNKYKPLVSFNARLMALSILMDAMLIGLMWLPNQTVFIQFHPVTYLVKLNIEMSMAKLITRLASKGASDESYPEDSESHPTARQSGNRSQHDRSGFWGHAKSVNLGQMSKVVAGKPDDGILKREGLTIHRRTDIEVKVDSKSGREDDEFPLTSNAGNPKVITIQEMSRAGSSTSRES